MSLKNIGNFNVISVADGDTLSVDRIPFPDKSKKVSLRLLNIDTEETTNAKFLCPVTQFGKDVKQMATLFFKERGNKVNLVVDDNALCGYFGRALVHVFTMDGVHYQKYAIENGWTPYYTKYGYAHDDYHFSFVEAQEKAKKDKKGIWSNEMRQRPFTKSCPYDFLIDWWTLRADEISRVKKLKEQGSNIDILLNGQDYDSVVTKAINKENACVFGELNRHSGGLFSFKVGIDKYFSIYIAKDAVNRDKIMKILEDKYITTGESYPESVLKPNYVCLTGQLSMFVKGDRSTPELIIYDEHQIVSN